MSLEKASCFLGAILHTEQRTSPERRLLKQQLLDRSQSLVDVASFYDERTKVEQEEIRRIEEEAEKEAEEERFQLEADIAKLEAEVKMKQELIASGTIANTTPM